MVKELSGENFLSLSAILVVGFFSFESLRSLEMEPLPGLSVFTWFCWSYFMKYVVCMISEPGCGLFLDVCLRALSCYCPEQNDCALVEPEDQCAQDGVTLNSLIKGCLFRLQFSLKRLVKHHSLATGSFSHQTFISLWGKGIQGKKSLEKEYVENGHTVANLAGREGYSLLSNSFSASVW